MTQIGIKLHLVNIKCYPACCRFFNDKAVNDVQLSVYDAILGNYHKQTVSSFTALVPQKFQFHLVSNLKLKKKF